MKKLFLFGSILVLALLLTSCVLFQKPLVLNYTGPEDELELAGPNHVTLSWESSIEKFEGVIKHDVLFGTDKENLEKIAEDIPEKEYVIKPSNFTFDQTYYWQIIAKAEKRDPEMGEIRSIKVDEGNVVVMASQGGNILKNAIYEMDEDDLIVTALNEDGIVSYSTARIHNYDKTFHYQVPLRHLVNPDWTDTPIITVSGADFTKEQSGSITFQFDIETGKNDCNGWFVFIGSETHDYAFPQGYDTSVTYPVNTTVLPNGNSYIRILAYNNNGDLAIKVIPLIVDNSKTHETLPGKIPRAELVSYSVGSNPNLRSNEINDYFFEEHGLKIEAEKFNLNNNVIFNLLSWTAAPDATGYIVKRSFENENNYRVLAKSGAVSYSDFSGELEIGKKTYYKIIPYNSEGINEDGAVVRSVFPVPSLEVNLLSPANDTKDVPINTTFRWEVNRIKENIFKEIDEEDYEILYTDFTFHIYDQSYFEHYFVEELEIDEENITGNIYEYSLKEDNFTVYAKTKALEPGFVYSWDIIDAAEIYIFENFGDAGFSRAVACTQIWKAGDGTGSKNGEFIFTTKLSENESILNPASNLFNYSGYEYSNNRVLVKSYDNYELGRTIRELNSEILVSWEKLDWSMVKVPANETVESFIGKLLKEKSVVFAQPDFLLDNPEPRVMKSEDVFTKSNSLNSVEELGDEVNMYRLWGLKNIRAEEAWETTTGSENVVLVIVDTGVDINHPEFANNIKIPGFDATGEGYENNDFDGHGTHVAGTAGAWGRDGNIAGVAWDSPIWPIRVQDSEGVIQNSYSVNAFNEVAKYAEENPDKRIVINYSIGGRFPDLAVKEAIDKLMENGVIFVTSAGNDDKRVPSYPTANNGIIVVGASTPTNGIADFSTTGPWTTVSAPGVSIYSTYPTDQGSYEWLQGTSMASPHVAGAVALLLAEYPDLTPVEVKNQLEQTSNDYGRGFTEEFGYGIIDLVEMLKEIKPNQYGSLNVETNLHEGDIYGFITIFDSEESLVAFGATGEKGNHMFHALKAGTYTFNVSYLFDDDEYYSITRTVEITAEQHLEVILEFDLELVD